MNKNQHFILLIFLLLFCLILPLLSFAEWSTPVMLGSNVNGGGEDYYPCLSLDGQDLYFTGMYMSGYGDDDIYVCHWEGNDWGPKQNLGPVINDSQRNLSPSISPDGDTLYFVSYGRPGGLGSYDIWKSWKIPGGGWATPVNMGPNVNTAGMEWAVYIAPDNNHLYISSNGWGGMGGLDIFVCARTDSGWTTPQSLENINYIFHHYSITMPQDMQTMYFSEAHYSATEIDIFMSLWENGEWGPEIWMEPPINTEFHDNCPTISADGQTMYFSSRRDTSSWDNDIYVTHWTEGIKKHSNLQFNNFKIIKSYPNPANGEVNIEFSDQNTKQELNIFIYDILGRLVFSDSRIINTGINIYKWKGVDHNQNTVQSGIYFAFLQNGSIKSNLIKIVLIK